MRGPGNSGESGLTFLNEKLAVMKTNLLRACIAAAAVATLPAMAAASSMSLAPATTDSGDTDVSTTRTLDRAFTFNGTAVVVNGVSFAAFPGGASPQTVGNTTLATSAGGAIGTAGGAYTGGTSSPFNGLSA